MTTSCKKTTTLLEKFSWENLDHSSCSLVLAPSNFHSFSKMKEFLSGKQMATDGVKETVTEWLTGLAGKFYDKGIIKLVQHLNSNKDYIEK
jgi:hypothetical protein